MNTLAWGINAEVKMLNVVLFLISTIVSIRAFEFGFWTLL